MRLIRPAHAEWQVAVRAVSALTGDGIDTVWDDVARFRAALEASGAWQRRRAEQGRAALWQEIGDGLVERFRAAPAVAEPYRRDRAGGCRGEADPGQPPRVCCSRRFPAANSLHRTAELPAEGRSNQRARAKYWS